MPKINKNKTIPDMTEGEKERFYRFVDKSNVDGCWPWTGYRNDRNYGQFNMRQWPYGASRVAYFLATGEDPVGLQVCHYCDNPPCCRPDHLFKGTNLENHTDKKTKGRAASKANGRWSWTNRPTGTRNYIHNHPEAVRGENNGFSKLNDAAIIDIRSRKASGQTPKEIATFYGVTPANIRMILRGVTWKHV